MQDILAVSLAAMQADAARLDRVSANLANATTNSYKREVFVQHPSTPYGNESSFTNAVSQAASRLRTPSEAAQRQSFEVVRDMKVGTVRATRQNLDLALSGPGFFEVGTAAGPAYTRNGQFQLDARGRVVTMQGHPLIGVSGEIFLTGEQTTIDAKGVITENGRFIAQLKIVNFDQPATLQPQEAGLFSTNSTPRVLPAVEIEIKQGFLENANVNSAYEMVQLMQTMRHFESMQKTVQGYDEMLGAAIRKLGDL